MCLYWILNACLLNIEFFKILNAFIEYKWLIYWTYRFYWILLHFGNHIFLPLCLVSLSQYWISLFLATRRSQSFTSPWNHAECFSHQQRPTATRTFKDMSRTFGKNALQQKTIQNIYTIYNIRKITEKILNTKFVKTIKTGKIETSITQIQNGVHSSLSHFLQKDR